LDRDRSKEGIITPFCDELVSRGVISYGLSSYGYDIRISDEFTDIYKILTLKLLTLRISMIVTVVDLKGDVCLIPPTHSV